MIKTCFGCFFYKLQKAICPIAFFSRVVKHETFRFNFYNMKNKCKKWIEARFIIVKLNFNLSEQIVKSCK